MFATQPILHYVSPETWNVPHDYLAFPGPDNGTVDDRAVMTISVDGYVSDTVILQQIDRG